MDFVSCPSAFTVERVNLALLRCDHPSTPFLKCPF